MARAIWKGAISFGLVTIPVGLFSAVERKERIAFRQLHAKDESPIDYKRFCEAEDVEVPWSEIVKGYEYEKGRYAKPGAPSCCASASTWRRSSRRATRSCSR